MSSKQGQVIARGAFQMFGSGRAETLTELLCDIFGRDDVCAVAADWRGIVYFTLTDDDEIDPSIVLGFDPSSGDSGELATLEEVQAAVRSGEIADAVDVESFDAWLAATDTRTIDMGECVPPAMPEFLGGDPSERATQPENLVSFVAANATLIARLEELGVQAGDEIPDELFDENRWSADRDER